jgi:predicted AlkP superfamily phosphohydrolase/phosphomutase
VRALLAKQSYDLVVAVFAEAHTGGHQAWEYRRDAKGDGPRPDHGMGDALLRLYRAVDDEIGRIVDALPPTATVVVASSVGMLSQYPTEELLEDFCRRLGYQASPAPAASSGPPPRRSITAMLRSLVPERARNLVSRFLPFHVQARLLSEKFAASTDWSRTTAYAPPGYYTGCIRVNLRGREPNGIVAPGAEYDALLSRLEEDLHALRDATTGAAVVARTVRTHEVFGDDAHPVLPDLIVFWNEHDRPLRRLRHPRAELTQSPHAFHRGSHHTTEGFLVAAGAAVRATGRQPDVDPLSLAPTMLTLLDVAPPVEMTGSPLHDWLTSPAFVANRT